MWMIRSDGRKHERAGTRDIIGRSRHSFLLHCTPHGGTIADQIFDQHVIFHGRDGQNPPGTAKAMSMRQVTVDFAMRTLTESGSVDLWGDTQMSKER